MNTDQSPEELIAQGQQEGVRVTLRKLAEMAEASRTKAKALHGQNDAYRYLRQADILDDACATLADLYMQDPFPTEAVIRAQEREKMLKEQIPGPKRIGIPPKGCDIMAWNS